MSRTILGATITMLAACSHPAARGPGADDPCLAAAHNLAGHEPADPPAEGSPERARLDERLAAACRNDAWSAELIDCMTTNVELEDYGACRALMSDDQADSLEGAWRDPERAGTEPVMRDDAASNACWNVSELAEALLAAQGAYRDERVIWTGATPEAEARFDEATTAIEGCKPGAFGAGGGHWPRMLWSASEGEQAAFDPEDGATYTDEPAREILLALWLVAVEDGDTVTLKVTVERDE